MLKRGLYFDGTDSLMISGFIINTAATLEFWLRPSADGTLLDVNSNQLLLQLVELQPTVTQGQAYTAGQTLEQAWSHCAFVVNNYELDVYVNGSATDIQTMSSVILDSAEYSHLLGSYYVGFIYSM